MQKEQQPISPQGDDEDGASDVRTHAEEPGNSTEQQGSTKGLISKMVMITHTTIRFISSQLRTLIH